MDLLLNEEILVVFPLMPRWKCADQHQESNRISPPTFIQETKTCNYQTIFFILEHHSAVHCPVLMPTVDDVNERPIRRAVLSSGCHGYRLTDRRNQIHILHPITQSTPTIIRDKVEHGNRHVRNPSIIKSQLIRLSLGRTSFLLLCRLKRNTS
jgi:hypothetical protein